MLTRETLLGPWAGLPVAWTDQDEFDEQTYRADAARCCQAGVPGVYTAGTTGEFYAMEFDEFKAVAQATVQECREHNVPVIIGCSSTYTLGVIRRAAYATELGADGIQVALPFWMEISDGQIVPFFKQVASAVDGLALSIYETTRAKKILTLDQHRAIKDVVPSYLMVKANVGTLGCTPAGCEALSTFVNVFVGEATWAKLGPKGAVGSCSSMIYYNPRVILRLWEMLKTKDWTALNKAITPVENLDTFTEETFGPKGFTDTAYDRLGGLTSGFLRTSLRSRGPYPSPTADDVKCLRRWYRDHFPEMLEL